MAESKEYGARLRSARQQAGMSLDEAGRRLRIEPQVLAAIEEADFPNMPPKYMTRSMVNAYAQLVGLNATATTREFLDAEYQYQLGRSSGGYYDNSQSSNQISTRIANPATIAKAAEAYGAGGAGASGGVGVGASATAPRPSFERSRASLVGRNGDEVSYRTSSAPAKAPGADSGWTPGGMSRVGAQLASDTGRQRVSVSDQDTSSSRPGVRRNPDGTIRRPRFTALEDPDMDYEDEPATVAPLNPAPKKDYSRLIMTVGCVLAVVLIVVLVKVLFIPETGGEVGPGGPVSGLTDPEQVGVGTSNQDPIKRTPIKPTACYVSIQVGDAEPLLGIFTTAGDFVQDDGSHIWSGRDDIKTVMDQYVESGTRMQYEVTDKMLIRASASVADQIVVTSNGEAVPWVRDAELSWFAIWVIDFPEYLEQWEAENLPDEGDEDKEDKE